MIKRILIIDSDWAFATALQEQLRDEGSLDAQVALSSAEAIQALEEHDFGLTILDMGLDADEFDDDESRVQAALDLIPQIRTARPDMRLMLIPLMGEDLPAEAAEMDIQGTLSKPFFVDDLLPRLERALALPPPRSKPAPEPPRPSSTPERVPARAAGPEPAAPHPASPIANLQRVPAGQLPADDVIRQALFELVRETAADAAVLVGPAGLTVYEGVLDSGRANALAQQVRHTLETSRQVSRFLEGSNAPLTHQILEGVRTRLYVCVLPPGHALAVLTPLDTTLGLVRVNMQRTSRSLRRLLDAGL
jgi:CheY-like chemotaxis protein/predicted regulator of Ras-like GTPase activity (Roadblock/LC7/MglB family)